MELFESLRRLPLLALLVCLPAAAEITYTTEFTSGPFRIVSGAAHLDWVVVNNDSEPVDIRVTIYQLNLGGAKTAEFPIITTTLEAGRTYHNANSYSPGGNYEVVVESTSDKVNPAVDQWNSSQDSIPGTLIPAGDFVKTKLVKPPKP